MSSTLFKNKFFISFVIFTFILCLLISPALSFKVSAADVLSFNVPIQKPDVNSRTRFIEVLDLQPTGYVCYIIGFEFAEEYNGPLLVNIQGNILNVMPSGVSVRYTSFYLSSRYGNMVYKDSGYTDNETISFSFTNIRGVHYYGFDFQDDSFPVSGDIPPFVVNYASDGLQLQTLTNIYNKVSLSSSDIASIKNYINGELDSYLSNMDFNLGVVSEEISNLSSFFIDGDFVDYMADVSGSLSNTYDLFNDFFNELSATDLHNYLTNIDALLYDTLNLLDIDIYDVLSDILASQNNLVNGWEPTNPDGESKFPDTSNPDNNNTPELNGAISDLDDIESEIKGDKTPEDYREEVGDILDKDKNNSVVEESTGVEPEDIDPEDITIVNQNVFNVVFQAFGGKFMTYFIMCLTLAFAAFVLGKRF